MSIMKKDRVKFFPGDLIAVFGGENSKDGKKSETVSICKVLCVGEVDIIVEEIRHSTFSSSQPNYVVPQNICCKLNMDPKIATTSSYLVPEIGDLVLSYTTASYKNDETTEATGILYKVVYKFGKPITATLLMGTEMKEFPFSSLIVLQRN
jgi:hypothetical protein